MTNSYISIDLETTGLNPKLDKIIEIGGVKVLDGKVTDTFSTFVSPGMKLKEQVVELTGIRDEMLTDAPALDEVMPKLMVFLEELPLLVVEEEPPPVVVDVDELPPLVVEEEPPPDTLHSPGGPLLKDLRHAHDPLGLRRPACYG